jgi:NAD(P)H-dependent FMN reductase
VQLYLPVLLGTTREGNRSSHVARYVAARAGERPGIESGVHDPAELPFGNLVKRVSKTDPLPRGVREFVSEMARADGFIVVTPEYNFGVPGALKNLLDHLVEEWVRKPFALVGVGGRSGGIRAIDNLRQVVTGLEAVVVPTSLSVHSVKRTFGEDGPTVDKEDLDARLERMLADLEWYARALRAARTLDPARP